jgi:hypothetical protein
MLNPFNIVNDPRHASTPIDSMPRSYGKNAVYISGARTIHYNVCSESSDFCTEDLLNDFLQQSKELHCFFIYAIKAWRHFALFLRLWCPFLFLEASFIALIVDLLALIEWHINHLHRIAFAVRGAIILFD